MRSWARPPTEVAGYPQLSAEHRLIELLQVRTVSAILCGLVLETQRRLPFANELRRMKTTSSEAPIRHAVQDNSRDTENPSARKERFGRGNGQLRPSVERFSDLQVDVKNAGRRDDVVSPYREWRTRAVGAAAAATSASNGDRPGRNGQLPSIAMCARILPDTFDEEDEVAMAYNATILAACR
jgi:hypothetical protein